MNKLVILIAAAMVLGTIGQFCYANEDVETQGESAGTEETAQNEEATGRGSLGKGFFTNHIKEKKSLVKPENGVGTRASEAYMRDINNEGIVPLSKPKVKVCKDKKTRQECQTCCEEKRDLSNGRLVLKHKYWWIKKECTCESRDNGYAQNPDDE